MPMPVQFILETYENGKKWLQHCTTPATILRRLPCLCLCLRVNFECHFSLKVFLLSLMVIQILGLKLTTINTIRRLLFFCFCNCFFGGSPRLCSTRRIDCIQRHKLKNAIMD